MEQPQKPSFWKSSAGKLTGLAIGIGVVGAAAAALAKKTSPSPSPVPPPAPSQGVQVGTTNAQGQTTFTNVSAGYYYLNVTSSSDPTAALSAAGFGQIQAQADPFNTGNWLVTAYWTAPGGAKTFTDGGTGTWQINVKAGVPTVLASAPPTPQQVTSLIASDWYTFSVRTSFVQSASNNGEAASGVLATALEAEGWGSPMITAAADPSSTPDTWNVAAQWVGSASVTQDAPPLWVLLGAPVNVGPTQPAQPGSAMP